MKHKNTYLHIHSHTERFTSIPIQTHTRKGKEIYKQRSREKEINIHTKTHIH